ncbi:MAG: hypothetical protein MI806_05395 [Minwuiales bacterium]|nr:hypothetical protein [Minwuiales bacterium]
MLVRIWRTSFDVSRKNKLVDYATGTSLPVLSSRPGNRGVIFYSDGDQWTTLTVWENRQAIDRLDDDPEYARIVDGIMALGVLGNDQDTAVFAYEGGAFGPNA